MPIASIIICTCNRADDLRRTLAALAGLCVPEDIPTELLVVDNGSTDATAAVVRACGLSNLPVRYVYEPRRGKGHAYNRGLAEAQGAVFLFTDDDVRPPRDWIAGMCGPILRGECDAVAGGVKIAGYLERGWLTPFHRSWLASTELISPEAPERMVGANMAFSRAVLDKVPGFDTELGPGALGLYDETLFTWQLQRAGFRLTMVPDTCVEHHFEEKRLSRHDFLVYAQKIGASEAYVKYHWEHEQIKWLPLEIARSWLVNFLWRIKHRKSTAGNQPPTQNELYRIYRYWFFRHFLRERRKSRQYPKHGLLKINVSLNEQRVP